VSSPVAYNGAAGATQHAMAGTLRLNGLSTATLNNDNAALRDDLTGRLLFVALLMDPS
jgi:serine protease inhibitor